MSDFQSEEKRNSFLKIQTKQRLRLFLQVSIDVEALNNAEAKSKEAAKAAEASAAALAKEVAQDAVEKKPPHKVS